jgi:hypothetical protein
VRRLAPFLAACLLALAASVAQATNYFSWGAENMVPQWGANGAYTGTASLRSATTIDSGVTHSGTKSMKVTVNMLGTNESVGIDLNGIPPPYPFNFIGSQLYYRWWMRFEPGFSWGDNSSNGWVKMGRVLTSDTTGAYYTGFMAANRFIIQECNYRDGGNYVGDCYTTDGVPSLTTAISIPYNLAAKADGQWHEYIARVKVNTSASCTPGVNCDADWEMYVDGVSVGRYNNFKLSSQNSQILEWWGSWGTNPYFQGNSSTSAGGTVYLDDFSTDDVWNSTFSSGSPPAMQSVSCSSPIQSPGASTCTASATNSPSSYTWTGQGTNCSYSGATANVSLTCTYGGSRTPCATATNAYGTSTQLCGSAVIFKYQKPSNFSGSVDVPASTLTCSNWQSLHPTWIWCDDFETDTSALWADRNNPSTFIRSAGNGYNNTYSMRATYSATTGVANAGDFTIAFGLSPVTPKVVSSDNNKYTDIYWRAFVRTSANWLPGTGAKLTRATSFVNTSWAQAMIAHFWDSSTPGILSVDPVSGVCQGGLKPDGVTPCTTSTVITTGWNDFANFYWLGIENGTIPALQPSRANVWQCIEGRTRLNDAGQSNGVQELWIDGTLDAQRTNLNFVGSYSTYGINIFRVENYMNAGTGQSQYRDWDNLVISATRIGCN